MAELAPWSDSEVIARRGGDLREERATVAAAANMAVAGGLDAEATEEVARVLGVLEAACALDARGPQVAGALHGPHCPERCARKPAPVRTPAHDGPGRNSARTE